jgi:hypothetical protein
MDKTIEKLISQVKEISDKELRQNANDIKKKKKELKYAKYISVKDIEVGNIIRFVELSGDKVLLPGVITSIIYEDAIIRYFIVYNNFRDIYWKIDPKKYYAFKMIKNYDDLIKLFKIKNI